jgi:hypothetical protein
MNLLLTFIKFYVDQKSKKQQKLFFFIFVFYFFVFYITTVLHGLKYNQKVTRKSQGRERCTIFSYVA